MNRVLAETLTLLNGVIAIVIIIAGLLVGYRLSGGTMMGIIMGGFVGFLFAALACGTLAYLALIERHLAKIAGSGSAQNASGQAAVRRDPAL